MDTQREGGRRKKKIQPKISHKILPLSETRISTTLPNSVESEQVLHQENGIVTSSKQTKQVAPSENVLMKSQISKLQNQLTHSEYQIASHVDKMDILEKPRRQKRKIFVTS